MPLAAGRLRHRINIQQQAETQDPATGDIVVVWVPFLNGIAAEVSPLSAREFLASQAVQSQVSARITLRYRADITAKMRIVFRGKFYNIEGILPDNLSGLEWMTLPVSEGVGHGG